MGGVHTKVFCGFYLSAGLVKNGGCLIERRKYLNMNNALHPRDSVARLYFQGKWVGVVFLL